jgi:hypothetical protein
MGHPLAGYRDGEGQQGLKPIIFLVYNGPTKVVP